MADLGTITYTSVVWTAGDVITEAKMDNMVANDQAYDSHAAQGVLLNNNKALAAKLAAGTNTNILKLNASNELEIGDTTLAGLKPMLSSAARGDIFYLNASLLLTRLAAGTSGHFLKTLGAGADPAWAAAAMSFKAGLFTRDMTAASGDVSYTGVGFTPKAILVFGIINVTTAVSLGFAVGVNSTDMNSIAMNGANSWTNDDTKLIAMYPAAGGAQRAVLKTFDADGFTLTWTKAASPTGTGAFTYLAIG